MSKEKREKEKIHINGGLIKTEGVLDKEMENDRGLPLPGQPHRQSHLPVPSLYLGLGCNKILHKYVWIRFSEFG